MTPTVACSDFLSSYQHHLTRAARARNAAAAGMKRAKQAGDWGLYSSFESRYLVHDYACTRLASAILRVLEPLA